MASVRPLRHRRGPAAEAAADTDLLDQAKENTDTFLTALLGELGYEDVVVRFETPTDPST